MWVRVAQKVVLYVHQYSSKAGSGDRSAKRKSCAHASRQAQDGVRRRIRERAVRVYASLEAVSTSANHLRVLQSLSLSLLSVSSCPAVLLVVLVRVRLLLPALLLLHLCSVLRPRRVVASGRGGSMALLY